MKISELLQSARLDRAMQIPVAIAGENRSLTLGQIIDALASSIVPFAYVNTTVYDQEQIGTGSTEEILPVVFDTRKNNFYALKVTISTVAGVVKKSAIYYQDFKNKALFYGDDNAVRGNCLFISAEGRLYKYSAGLLISAGITDAQAQQLKLLTPEKVADENALKAMEEAGLIVPGQIYYIPEND